MSQKRHRPSRQIHFHGIVKHPFANKILSWILLICFMAMLIGAWSGEDKNLNVLLAVFLLGSVLLILFYHVEQVSFDDNGFTYRNFLGFSHRYDYAQIIKVQEKEAYNRFGAYALKDIILTVGARKIRLQGNMDNLEHFKICILFKCGKMV